MKSSSRRGIEVFDFDEDDDVNDAVAVGYSGKLRSPCSDDHALTTRESLECVSPGTVVQKSGIENVHCVGIDAVEQNPSCGNATLTASVDKSEDKIVSMNECCEEIPSSNEEQHSEFKQDNDGLRNSASEAEKRCLEHKASSLAKFQLNCDHLDSSSDCEPIDVTSDVDESLSRSSSPSPASVMEDYNDLSNGCAQEHFSDDMETDDVNMTVVLYPDYIIYRDNYYTEPHVIFSDNCVKIMGSTAYDNQETFEFEWGFDDVVNIACQIFQRVETVMIKLQVLSKDENVHQLAGIDDVKIFVVEPNWQKKEEEITSLNRRYLHLWNHVDDIDMAMGTAGDDSPRLRRYFPVFQESFDEVIYPKGEADAVSISKRDVDLLQPETFINDTIVDFYIKYLKNQIPPADRHKFHFFNSFFFRKLADLDKDPSSASDGAAAFQRVRKWTRKVDLFGKEFVFVPINFSLHWSLIVLCHPGEAATFTDENLDKSLKVPCILHMDSIKGNHAGLKHLIQSYLWEEWKERTKETSEEVSSRFHNLRFVSLELPQQENSFDCGLFLLHYLESFLAEVPDNFNPFKIEQSSSFLNINWFPPTEASLKRALIQRLISELLKRHSQEVSSSASSDDEQVMESNVNGVGAHFLSARFDPGPSCQQNNLSSSEVGQGIELTLLSSSLNRDSQCINDSDLVLRDLFNPGASLVEQCQSFDQKSSDYRLNGTISPLEEDPETGEQFMFGETQFHRLQLTGITPQTGNIPYPSKEYDGETFGVGISLQAEGGIDCSSDPDDSSDIAITETFQVAEHSSPNRKERTDTRRSPSLGLVSASHESPDTPAAAEASQNRDLVQSGNENISRGPTFLEYQDVLVSQGSCPSQKDRTDEHQSPSVEHVECVEGLASASHELPSRNRDTVRTGNEVEFPASRDSVMEDKEVDLSDNVHMIEYDDMVDSNSPEEQPSDNRIGSGDHEQSDCLVDLEALEPQPLGFDTNAVEVCLDGLVSPGLESVENKIGSLDNALMVVDVPVVPDSPKQQPVVTATGSGDNTQIAAVEIDGSVEDAIVLVGNPSIFEDDNATGLGEDSQIFEDASDASVGPDSPGQKPADDVVAAGDNSQVIEGTATDLESPRDQLVDINGTGVDHNVEIAPIPPGLQSSDNGPAKEDEPPVHHQAEKGTGLGDKDIDLVIDLGNVTIVKHNSAAPDSPRQNSAKRPRLSSSEEDEAGAAESLAEN